MSSICLCADPSVRAFSACLAGFSLTGLCNRFFPSSRERRCPDLFACCLGPPCAPPLKHFPKISLLACSCQRSFFSCSSAFSVDDFEGATEFHYVRLPYVLDPVSFS